MSDEKPVSPVTSLVLRTCNADLTSHQGFQWPASGPVEAPDWSSEAECGHGLHGLLWGEGGGQLLDWSEDAKWLVVEVDAASTVEIGQKVKFPRGTVIHVGDRKSATEYLLAHGAVGKKVTGAIVSSGDGGTSTSGYGGTSTSGDWGTLSIEWWDAAKSKWRRCVAEVGENGIEPNQPYRLEVVDGKAQWVKAEIQEKS